MRKNIKHYAEFKLWRLCPDFYVYRHEAKIAQNFLGQSQTYFFILTYHTMESDQQENVYISEF